MNLRDVIDILTEFDFVHDETVSQEHNKGIVDYNKREIRIASGLRIWDARKTVVHELEHVRRRLNNIATESNELLITKETNKIIQDAYKISSPERSPNYRTSDQEITDELLRFLLAHIKVTDSITCGSRKCKYYYGHGNRCYLKHVYLRNGICRYFSEGEFADTRTDIPREILFGKLD